MWRRLIFGVAICLVAVQVCAQEPPPAPCTFRTLPVTVLDKNGEPITGLTAADFRAEFRGKPVRIVSVGLRARPVKIAVVLDTSGSMRSHWRLAMNAVRDVLSNAPEDAHLALLLFGGTGIEKTDFAQRRASLIEALANLRQALACPGVYCPLGCPACRG
jgi:hypothetical protein